MTRGAGQRARCSIHVDASDLRPVGWRCPGGRAQVRARGSTGRRGAHDESTHQAGEAGRFDQVSLGEVMLRLDPGEGRIHTTRTLPGLGGRRRVQRRARAAALLRPADRDRDRARATTRSGRLVEDLMLQGGVDLSLPPLGAVRRRGARGPQRAQLHRARLRPARRRRLLRPRPHRRLAAASPATSTGTRIFGTDGRPLVPHRRHLRRASPRRRPPSRARRWRRRAGTARSSPTTSTTATRSGVDRRPGARARGEPRARAARRRDVRQRGGLHRRARLRGRGRSTSTSPRSTRRTSAA